MKYHQLGHSGLTVSAVGLGCNNFGRANSLTETQAGTDAVVNACLEEGITFFDTADVYGKHAGLSEQLLGNALVGKRDHVVLATKFGMDVGGLNGQDHGVRGSRAYIIKAVESSLCRLGTDYIDLYQFHTPDTATPIDETLSALDDLITAGKVRYIGHSNRAGWQIADAEYVAQQLGAERFISAQNHYNLLDRRAELEVLPAAEAYGLGVLPYFPLASGLLTGKYSTGTAPAGSRLSYNRTDMVHNADLEQLAAFGDFARARGVTEVDVAFGWLLAKGPISSVIAGATSAAQVKANAATVNWQPNAEDLAALDEIFPAPDPIALF